jgi:hypothetical protein
LNAGSVDPWSFRQFKLSSRGISGLLGDEQGPYQDQNTDKSNDGSPSSNTIQFLSSPRWRV